MRRWPTRRPRRWRSRRRPSEILDRPARLRALPDVGAGPEGRHRRLAATTRAGATEVTFRAAAMGRSTSYTLRYDYDDDRARSWDARARRHHAPARRLATGSSPAVGADGRTSSPTTSPSTSSSAARVREAPGRAQDHPHRPPRAAAPTSSRPVTARSCCSPARAASARPRPRPPPRCGAPTPACARSSSPPTRPTPWPTPSTCRSARSPRPITRRPVGPAARRPGADGGVLGRDPGLAARGLRRGPASTRSRPRSCRCSPGSTRSSPSPTSRPTPTSGEWDVIVVDCAPTAETIRLLSLPDILAWYMERLFPVGRRVNKVVGAGAVTGDRPAGRRRRRVRGDQRVLRPARRRARAPHRPGPHQRAARREPRADGHRRGPPHLHLPVAVRLPRSTP